MQFKLKPLDYPTNALEPQIDARTVEIHHDKHQAAYVANLNAALESSPEFGTHTDLLLLIKNLRDVPENPRGGTQQCGRGMEPRILLGRAEPEKDRTECRIQGGSGKIVREL